MARALAKAGIAVTVLEQSDADALAGRMRFGDGSLAGSLSVQGRVVARGGRPAVRLMATLCCTGDHKVWDGQRVGKLLGEIARILETDELAKEVPVHEAEAATHVALDSAG